ncbi:hypothetical protein GKC33_00360 [Lactobacillus salivarius]|uniref:Uncharacterized protein n=1 Tax=Ligilactobacillus salivarius TaxID=1624 RepID=A0A6A8LM12_9LACO|nr:hypothetical protein [Ligilactobacillus salivarius]MSE04283.1 hypothetical protein [Ligilactobacillus salivarius]MSE07219.1 hypothetical protein [Ligilactobacillus salivarius]
MQQYKNKLAENAKKIADYQSSLAKNSFKEIDVNTIWQNLVLSDEPDAKLSIQWSKNATGIITQNTNNMVLYADLDKQDGQTAKFNGSQSGTVATATWTNLKNSYYIDSNGIKHTIGKLVRIYSDLRANGQNNSNPLLKIYRNPYLNAATYFASDITAQYFMYGINGDLLSIGFFMAVF